VLSIRSHSFALITAVRFISYSADVNGKTGGSIAKEPSMTEFATAQVGAIVRTENGCERGSSSDDGFCGIRNPRGCNSSSTAGAALPVEKWRATLAMVGRNDLHAVRSQLRAAWAKASQTWQQPATVYHRGYRDID
jgi:hypothetical protein